MMIDRLCDLSFKRFDWLRAGMRILCQCGHIVKTRADGSVPDHLDKRAK